MTIKESDIRRQIQDYLRWNGWTVLYHLQGLGCYKGMSDLQALKDGRSVFIEVKRPGGRQNEAQKAFQELVEAAGFEYVLAKDVTDVEHLGGERQLRIAETDFPGIKKKKRGEIKLPEVNVNIEIYCAKCGDGLCNQTEFALTHLRREPSFRVEPCQRCLDNAAAEGYDKGYAAAKQEMNRGR